jgi:hypothetical protein
MSKMLIYSWCTVCKGKISNQIWADNVIMVPIFYLIISSCSMIDPIQLLNLIPKSVTITSPKFLAHYVNCLRLHHQMWSEFDGFHSMRFSRKTITLKLVGPFPWNKKRLGQQCVVYLPTSRNIFGYQVYSFEPCLELS